MTPTKEPLDRQDDHQIWPVRLGEGNAIHGVKGGHCRVTICGVDFISTDYHAAPPLVTCLHCLELLGGLLTGR